MDTLGLFLKKPCFSSLSTMLAMHLLKSISFESIGSRSEDLTLEYCRMQASFLAAISVTQHPAMVHGTLQQMAVNNSDVNPPDE